MGLLDVNALVALAWDSHIHHVPMRQWFLAHRGDGWATCPITEAGFVRVSSNPVVLPSPIGIAAARRVLASLRHAGRHDFIVDDVSMTDADLPKLVGHRQVTDAHLLTIARRRRTKLVTFDAGVYSLAGGVGVELLSALT